MSKLITVVVIAAFTLGATALATMTVAVPVAEAAPIGINEALDRTGKYARVVCDDPTQARGCEGWAVRNCVRHDGGVSCKAHFFIRRTPEMNGRPGKFDCIRLVFHTRTDRDFLGGFKCKRGWSGFDAPRRTAG